MAPNLKYRQIKYTIKQKPHIPNVVVVVRAKLVIFGKCLTLALEPQAKNVTDIKPINNPTLNFRSNPCIPKIIILPRSTSVNPMKKLIVKRLLSNIISRMMAAIGIKAAARAAMKLVVKICVTTRSKDPSPKPKAPIKNPFIHFAFIIFFKFSERSQNKKIKRNAIKFLTKTTEMTPQSFNSTSRAGKPMAKDRAAKTQVRFDLSRKIFLCEVIKFLRSKCFF